jgi:hypothetical protein
VAWPSELLRERDLRELLDVGVLRAILEENLRSRASSNSLERNTCSRLVTAPLYWSDIDPSFLHRIRPTGATPAGVTHLLLTYS